MLVALMILPLLFQAFFGMDPPSQNPDLVTDDIDVAQEWPSYSALSGKGFIENMGQKRSEGVEFYWAGDDWLIEFLRDEVRIAIFEFHEIESGTGDDGLPAMVPRQEAYEATYFALSFEGANHVGPTGRTRLEGVYNFFTSVDSSQWRREVPRYSQVVYENIYDGIDLVYRFVDGNVKYEFVVRPFADPCQIRVKVNGCTSLQIGSGGDLIVGTGLRSVRDTNLYTYVQGEPSKEIRSSFVLFPGDAYGFRVGQYPRTSTLVIDPDIYTSYLGGEDFDTCIGIDHDGDCNIYVAGTTRSDDFPITSGSFNWTGQVIYDAYVSMFDPRTWSLVYSTFLRGEHGSEARDLAVDAEGHAHLTGFAYGGEFPKTPGSFGVPGETVFLAKLAQNGSDLIYSTVLGGNYQDEVQVLTLDAQGRAIIGGESWSVDFPIVPGSYVGTDDWGNENIFITKFSKDGSELVFSTFFGGDRHQSMGDICVGPSGKVYVTGDTRSTNFPTTPGAYQRETINFWYDGYVGVFDENCTRLEAMTLFGGEDFDIPRDLTVDERGMIYVVGHTESQDYPTTVDAYYDSYRGGENDGFLSVFDDNCTDINYSTYMGGSAVDHIENIELSPQGDVYLAGYTESNNIHVTSDGIPPPTNVDPHDGIFIRMDPTMTSFEYSAYLGGTSPDWVYDMTVLKGETILMAGQTQSPDLPVSDDAFQNESGGDIDGMIVVLNYDSRPPDVSAGHDIVARPFNEVVFDGSGSTDNMGIVNWTWTFEDFMGATYRYGPKTNFTFQVPGLHNATLTVTDAMNNSASLTLKVVVVGRFSDIHVNLGEETRFGSNLYSACPDSISWVWRLIDHSTVLERLYGSNPVYIPSEPGLYMVEMVVTDRTGNSVSEDLYLSVLPKSGSFALAGQDVTIDQHGSVTFDGTGCSIGIVQWEWTVEYEEELIRLLGPVSNHTFDEAGSFIVNLVVEDVSGGIWGDEMTVVVNDTTPPTPHGGIDVEVDQYSTVIFNISDSYDNVGIVNWSFAFIYDGERIVLQGPVAPFVFNVVGNYTVYFFIIDAVGLDAEGSFNVTVRDITNPSAFLGPDVTIDQYETFFFDGANCTDNVGVVNYTWSFSYHGEMMTMNGPYPNYKFEEVGRVKVELVVYDAAGLWDTAQMWITIVDTTSPTAFAGDDFEVLQGDLVFLNGMQSSDNNNVVNWTWKFEEDGEEVELFGPTPEYVFRRPGVYTVSLTVVDEAGNHDTDTTIVTVKRRPDVESDGPWPLIAIGLIAMALIVCMVLFISRSKGSNEGQ